MPHEPPAYAATPGRGAVTDGSSTHCSRSPALARPAAGPGNTPTSEDGQRLLAHELTHVLQQGTTASVGGEIRCASEFSREEQQAAANAEAVLEHRRTGSLSLTAPMLQRRAAPYIKRITVHLTPPQSADLEWEGTPPGETTGSDHFTVSTGKGYGDPGDPPGTCRRNCCRDPMSQCAPPWNQPDKVGAWCTYYGSSFRTGTLEPEHGRPGGWKPWIPIQTYYASRGIALHQHTEATGQPIGHDCVRMEEDNARRIAEFSNGRRTNVTIDGRAAPVLCETDRRCGAVPGGGASGALGEGVEDSRLTVDYSQAVPGLEGVMT